MGVERTGKQKTGAWPDTMMAAACVHAATAHSLPPGSRMRPRRLYELEAEGDESVCGIKALQVDIPSKAILEFCNYSLRALVRRAEL